VQKGDYIIRGDQPYRTLADMYFSVQNFAPGNPRPYDDTGWTFQLMRNVKVSDTIVTDQAILAQAMTPVTGRREGVRRRRRDRARRGGRAHHRQQPHEVPVCLNAT
jgi:hypothetical protein